MTPEEILSPTLGNLEFDRLSYLFHWPGELIQGSGYPIATLDPETVKQKDLTDYKYRRRTDSEYPIPDRFNFDRHPAPEESAVSMRNRLLPRHTRRPLYTPPEDSFSRPNATAFDLMQNEAHSVSNTVLDGLGLKTLKAISVEAIDPAPAATIQGAVWAFSLLTEALMDVTLFDEALVGILGIPAAAQVVRGHLPSTAEGDRLAEIAQRFKEQDFRQIQTAAETKLNRIALQSQAWVDAGRSPVLGVDGKVNEPLTLCNVAAATVGLELLRRSAGEIKGFADGVQQVGSEF